MEDTLNLPVSKAQIIETHRQIQPYIHRTAVLTSSQIDGMIGASLFFKCENFQKVGAFKARGAMAAVQQLDHRELANGLATHSSGNHAQAVAYAAKLKGVKAYIVMPETAPSAKVAAVKGYGAEVVFCAPTLAAREETLGKVLAKTAAHFIHPYNDYRVIAGQATAAKELIEDIPNLDVILAPVGGGGLLAGTGLSAHYFGSAKVLAGEPEGADDALRSFYAGRIIPSAHPKTIADGLLTSLGEKGFGIIQQTVSDIISVSDAQIIEAMRIIWERMKIIIEPSCAVPFAVVRKHPALFTDKRVGIILTGGNVDLVALPF